MPNEIRIPWTTQINIKPSCLELLRAMAHGERMSLATTIGLVIESYVTARSTA
jgi:hypothetical protein